MDIQGISLGELASKYGTPLYVYDAEEITEQFKKMKNAFQVPKLGIHYACKALTNISILKLMKNLGAGLDTVSIQEVELGLKAGFQPEEILFTPNSVSWSEIERAMQLGVKLNIDNISMLERIGHLQKPYPVCIRINPHIMAGGHYNISVGHIDSKFGISIHQMPLVKRLVEALNIEVEGVHMHTGSDILQPEVFINAADILLGVAKDFPNLKYVDFGSGFKVKYKADDFETDIQEFGKLISDRFNQFCEETGKDLELIFEPGKYLVSSAGYFLAQANVIKQTTSTIFVGLDTGFNHLIRPMFYDAHHDIENITNTSGSQRIYTVVGYICETDTFGWNRKLNEVREGDILLFKNAGAYCYMMSSNYNSRYKPAEVLIYKGKDHLIRRRETMDDLLKNQVELDFNREKSGVIDE